MPLRGGPDRALDHPPEVVVEKKSIEFQAEIAKGEEHGAKPI